MRKAFISTLCEIAETRSDLVLLSADMGFSVLETFATRFPGRFINVGVAEQNMMGLAAGLAASGKTVVTYSIANFALMRCMEQFRNDICYHNLPVIAVSVGAGLAYGVQGYSHHGIEDVGLSRLLPHVAVASPGDPAEVRVLLRQLAERRGPASLRLGRGGEPAVHATDITYAPFAKALVIRPSGRDMTFIASGGLLAEAAKAADQLSGKGLDVGLISLPVIIPLDCEAITNAARTSRCVVTVEEHAPQGALGSAVAEVVAGLSGQRATVIRAGIAGVPLATAHDQAAARRHYGLDAASLSARALEGLA